MLLSLNMNTTSKEIAQLLMDIHAVSINLQEPFRYTSGILSPIYCDNRLILSYPEKRRAVIDAFLNIIDTDELDYDCIGGVATGAIAGAALIADRLNAPMIYIRTEAKKHGKKSQVEGRLEEGARVLIIEDHVSTGGSSVAAIEAVREIGGVVSDCVAITTYEQPAAQQKFADAKVHLYTLTNLSTIVEVAVASGYLQEKDRETVLSWSQDAAEWGKKMGLEQ